MTTIEDSPLEETGDTAPVGDDEPQETARPGTREYSTGVRRRENGQGGGHLSAEPVWRFRHTIIGALAVLVVIAALLPWAKVSADIFSATKAGTDGDGVITLLLGLALAAPVGLSVYGLMKDRVTGVMIGLIGAIIGAIGIYDWADLTNKAGQIDDSPAIDISVSVGAGLVLTTIAGALIVAAAVVLFWLPARSPEAEVSEAAESLATRAEPHLAEPPPVDPPESGASL